MGAFTNQVNWVVPAGGGGASPDVSPVPAGAVRLIFSRVEVLFDRAYDLIRDTQITKRISSDVQEYTDLKKKH